MATFEVSSIVESLDYDFTDAPSNSGEGNCKGFGTIPEPTQSKLEKYADDVAELFGLDKNDTPKQAIAKAEKSARKESDSGSAKTRKYLEITSELCSGTPSADEIEDLPPRLRNAFMKWFHKAVADPEVLSAGTQS